jgi:hypothetical protein
MATFSRIACLQRPLLGIGFLAAFFQLALAVFFKLAVMIIYK